MLLFVRQGDSLLGISQSASQSDADQWFKAWMLSLWLADSVGVYGAVPVACGAVMLSENGLPDSISSAADIRMLTMSMPECQVWSIAACTFSSNKLTVNITVNVLPGSNWSCCLAPAQPWANIQTGGHKSLLTLAHTPTPTHTHTHTHTHTPPVLLVVLAIRLALFFIVTPPPPPHTHTHTLWHTFGSGLVLVAITSLGTCTYELGVRAKFGWTSLDWVVIATRDVGDTMVVYATYLKYHRCHLSCLPFVWHFFSLWLARAQKCTPGPGGDSPWRVTRARDSCLCFGRTSLDLVTICDWHVLIVVLAVGLAMSLHCDKLAFDLIICLAWPHESWIFWQNLVGRGGDLHFLMSVIWRSCPWKYRLSFFKCHLPGTLFSLCFTCIMHTHPF